VSELIKRSFYKSFNSVQPFVLLTWGGHLITSGMISHDRASDPLRKKYVEFPIFQIEAARIPNKQISWMNMKQEINIADMDPTSYFAVALMDMNISSDRCPLLALTCGPMCKCSLCTNVYKSTRSMMTSATNSTRTDSDESITDFNFHNRPVLTVKRLVVFDDSASSMLITPDDYMESASEISWVQRRQTTRKQVEQSELGAPEEEPSDQEMQKVKDELDRLQEEDFQLKLRENQLELEVSNLKLLFEEAASAARCRRLAIQKDKLGNRREDSMYDYTYDSD
jgi:hypothetical protein